jgi:nucleotide-binding universal stress UspA family protein
LREEKAMRILITTDGSDFSRAAVEKCCQMVVKPEETAIKIVSVYDLTLPLDVFPAPSEFSDRLESGAREQAEEFAREAEALIREHFPHSNIDLTTQTAVGAPEKILIEEAKEWNADLVVVGSHGRGFWGRILLGSTTDALVHHAPCSVLVVRKPRKA